MKLHFVKYQATGNDFVLFDNRRGNVRLSVPDIQKICDRRFGIGADGLILIENDKQLDFNINYYNSDGSQSLCGNGTRAAVKMASSLGIINGKTTFNAFDGAHHAEIFADGRVKVRMNDVKDVVSSGNDEVINTGSPHLIRFISNVAVYPVFEEGRKLRYSDTFKPGGINVNFAELLPDNRILVRTYERGVENETLSCGTGVTAVALASSFRNYKSPVSIKTPGGDLTVEFKTEKAAGLHGQAVTFSDIFLIGPAKMVFEGDLDL
jgi:diaminopimelate epimerase